MISSNEDKKQLYLHFILLLEICLFYVACKAWLIMIIICLQLFLVHKNNFKVVTFSTLLCWHLMPYKEKSKMN
jgi:hypothetical protein